MTNQAGHATVVQSPRRWDFLAGLMRELGLRSFVEVGCKEGRTTGHILKTVPSSTVIAIDPWMVAPAEANGDATREDYKDWDFGQIEKEFWANVGAENESRCDMWRTTSLEAAELCASKGETGGLRPLDFDLVFIDALHDYESVAADIAAWWPLVRDGGVLAGHDFNHKWPGVERAVADAFDLMQVGLGSDSVWFVVKHGG